MTPDRFDTWLYPGTTGLYCAPGNFYIDPHRPAERAFITHGHADHARPGHTAVHATPETLAIMALRLGKQCGDQHYPLQYGEVVTIGDVTVWLAPAGHVLGSAQVVLEWEGKRAVVSGDYKRRADLTCAPFEVVPCDLFVTEATFGLPVFRHEPDAGEVAKLLSSVAAQPERAHLVGAYGLGKCQRLIALLRAAGHDAPIYMHGAVEKLCRFYEEQGVDLGVLRPAAGVEKNAFAGHIVMAPPSALQDRWSRRLPDPVTCFASGWMRVRGRARQRGVELPLIISDHADWPELVRTIEETGAREVWVTHGREDALCHQITMMGLTARALALVGRDDEDDDSTTVADAA
ncbi:MAG: ligase-associated DNA damage response exonuclease [Pseudomonadota bacterium]